MARGQADAERTCRKDNGIPQGADVYTAAAGGCGISDMRPWSVGDNVSLAIGQGDVQSSPLQMAVTYATIANGGRVPRPHLGLEIQDQSGRLVQDIDPGPARKVEIDPEHQAAIMNGLRASVQAPGGTSTPVFAGWPHDRYSVAGKTGTAQTPQGDQSWYVAVVEAGSKSLVVAATVERGGFGAERAAPVVCRMLRNWYDVKDVPCAAGSSTTR